MKETAQASRELKQVEAYEGMIDMVKALRNTGGGGRHWGRRQPSVRALALVARHADSEVGLGCCGGRRLLAIRAAPR